MQNIIEKFYEGLANLDAETMIEYYHEEIEFEDPAFGVLRGEKAGNMWRMLCSSSRKAGHEFKVKLSDVIISDQEGKSHIEAHYTFSKSGRRVHNKINSEFLFKDGKIIRHKDSFDLYRWSRQALGLTGYLLGWSGYFRKKLNSQTNRMLANFEKKQHTSDPTV